MVIETPCDRHEFMGRVAPECGACWDATQIVTQARENEGRLSRLGDPVTLPTRRLPSSLSAIGRALSAVWLLFCKGLGQGLIAPFRAFNWYVLSRNFFPGPLIFLVATFAVGFAAGDITMNVRTLEVPPDASKAAEPDCYFLELGWVRERGMMTVVKVQKSGGGTREAGAYLNPDEAMRFLRSYELKSCERTQ